MNKKCNWQKSRGFSLIDTVVSISLVGMLVASLLLLWEFAGVRERGMESYWVAKQEVESAYEITHRYLRKYVRSNLQTSSGRISFTGTDNLPWVFYLDGESYKMAHNSNVTVLIEDSCTGVSFTSSGSQVMIQLTVEAPANWQGAQPDLSIRGRVFLRNLL